MGRKITMFRITSIILLLALAFQLNAQSLLLFEDEYELNSIPGLQLLVLPNRDLAGGVPASVTDFSGNGNNGTFENSMELNQTAGLKYYTFDGTDDYIECSSPVNFTSNFTLISIFKTSASGIRVIYGNGDFGLNDRGYTLFLDDGVLRYGESSTGADYIQYRLNQAKSYADGAIHFVALTKNSTTHKFYDSGEEKTVTLISGTPVASLHQATAPLIIGAIKTSGVPSGFHNGTQGLNIAVNQTLTQAQIKQIYYSSEIQSIMDIYSEYELVMEITDNAATTSSLRLNSGGIPARVDWSGTGDYQEIATDTETTSPIVPSNVKIYAWRGILTYFYSTDNNFSFDIANLPSGLTSYLNYGSNTTSGDIANLPSGLTSYYNAGSNTTTGDIANLPDGLTHYINSGLNTTSGDIANLPSGLTYYLNYGSNTTSGDIANLPSGLTSYLNYGQNQVNTYTAGRTWSNNMNAVIHKPASGYGLSSTEVDNLLIDLANVSTWAGDKVIELAGNNAARTSASDAAVATLQSKGVTVTTN